MTNEERNRLELERLRMGADAIILLDRTAGTETDRQYAEHRWHGLNERQRDELLERAIRLEEKPSAPVVATPRPQARPPQNVFDLNAATQERQRIALHQQRMAERAMRQELERQAERERRQRQAMNLPGDTAAAHGPADPVRPRPIEQAQPAPDPLQDIDRDLDSDERPDVDPNDDPAF